MAGWAGGCREPVDAVSALAGVGDPELLRCAEATTSVSRISMDMPSEDSTLHVEAERLHFLDRHLAKDSGMPGSGYLSPLTMAS
ncbi:hypothetical protein SGRIM128S_00569 [Streptomyces griseomycini]